MRIGPKPLSYYLQHVALEHAKNNDVDKMLRFVAGVKRYQSYDGEIDAPALKVLHQVGPITFKTLAENSGAHASVCFLVPSLINGASIFNVRMDHSLMRFLDARNIMPILIDWGDVAAYQDWESLEDLLFKGLVPGVSFLCDAYDLPAHMLGYCLGGIFALVAALQLQERLSSVSFLATPWDFDAGDQSLRDKVRFWWGREELSDSALVSGESIHTLLGSLNPAAIIRKFESFSDVSAGGDREGHFVAVEDWLNESYDVPYGVMRQCVRDLFVDNRGASGGWSVGGCHVDPSLLQTPSLVITSRGDHLVPYECALGLYDQLCDAALLSLDTGHIGLMAGRGIKDNFWHKFSDFIHGHSDEK